MPVAENGYERARYVQGSLPKLDIERTFGGPCRQEGIWDILYLRGYDFAVV